MLTDRNLDMSYEQNNIALLQEGPISRLSIINGQQFRVDAIGEFIEHNKHLTLPRVRILLRCLFSELNKYFFKQIGRLLASSIPDLG